MTYNNIIVSLTTIPVRLYDGTNPSCTRMALNNILTQSGIKYKVQLNVPFKYKGTSVELPDWIKEYEDRYDHFEVYRTDDYGPITKILPTLERTVDDDIIITVDDDLYYMDGFITAHLDGRKKYPNCALGFAGISAIDGSCHFCTTLNKDIRVKILEGYKTVSYKRSFFDIDELKLNFLNKSWNDDLILSAYMGYKNIQKIVLNYKHDTDFIPRVESFPVFGHIPVERSGCNIFRNDTEIQKISEKNINEFYKIGYLER